MQKLNASLLEEALNLLAESTEDHPVQHWVVCGGSSLLALGLVSRTTTHDVDVLARVELDGLITARPLPEWLANAAEQVRKQLVCWALFSCTKLSRRVKSTHGPSYPLSLA